MSIERSIFEKILEARSRVAGALGPLPVDISRQIELAAGNGHFAEAEEILARHIANRGNRVNLSEVMAISGLEDLDIRNKRKVRRYGNDI